MSTLQYFFRTNTDVNTFQMFGSSHIAILIFSVITSYFLLKKIKKNRSIELILGTTLLTQQVTLYTWYILNNYNVLSEGLPLYHCRIAIIVLGLGFVLNNIKLKKFGAYWGLMGSFFALLIPGPDPFIFPHLTIVSYFVGHVVLLWGSLYTLFISDTKISKIDVGCILMITNIYSLLMFIVNTILGSNYGYMNQSPILLPMEVNQVIYSVITIMLIDLALVVVYIINEYIKLTKEEDPKVKSFN